MKPTFGDRKASERLHWLTTLSDAQLKDYLTIGIWDRPKQLQDEEIREEMERRGKDAH